MSVEVQFHRGTCYRLTGQDRQKPVMVLIHGVGLNQDMWQTWIPLLSQSHDVLTFDLFGHGHSVNPDGPRSAGDFVDQLMDLVDYLGIDRFALIGFSLGAVVTQAVASLHGSRLAHAYNFFCYAEAEMKRYALNHFERPALVITGSAETGSTPEMSQALAFDLSHPELIINPGHYHMAPVEHADLLATQVLSFLNKHQTGKN